METQTQNEKETTRTKEKRPIYLRLERNKNVTFDRASIQQDTSTTH